MEQFYIGAEVAVKRDPTKVIGTVAGWSEENHPMYPNRIIVLTDSMNDVKTYIDEKNLVVVETKMKVKEVGEQNESAILVSQDAAVS